MLQLNTQITCVGSSPRPLTLWRPLALPPTTFLVFPGEHKLYTLYKPFNNNMSRKNKMQIQYFKTNTWGQIRLTEFSPVPVVLLTLCAAVSCVPAAPVDRLGLTVVTLKICYCWSKCDFRKTLDHNILLTHCFFLLSEISPLYFSVRFSTFEFNLRIFFSCRVMSSSMVTKYIIAENLIKGR